jgi:glycosyltransferase involved in cell wall biosynthesis
VKRYPRFSETFIVNEILAHEAAGLEIEIFSLRPPVDAHFQDLIARVRAGVTYLPSQSINGDDLWGAFREAARPRPDCFWPAVSGAGSEAGRDLFQAALLAQEIHHRGLTHLHAHFASGATSVARLAARMAGISYSFTAHAKDIYHESVDPGDLRRKLRDASAVVTVSDYNVAFLRGAYGAAAGRVRRIYNGLDLELFPYSEPAARPRHILAVGRLVEKKGFGILIDACARLQRQGIPFTCEIIGAGELHADLAARITRHALGDRVVLAGPLPQPEVRRRITRAAVFAAPCVTAADGNRDGLPTVLLEAMALGTPCVSTNVTGIPEIIRHDLHGLLVDQGNSAMLADALALLLGDDARRERLARQARRLIEERFDIHVNAAGVRDLFTGSTPRDVTLAVPKLIGVPA